MASSIIDSKLKSLKPPTAYSCALVDTANQTVYFKLFNDCLQAGGDASYVERVTHLIMVASKMKGATCVGGLLPLVEGLPSGSDKMVKDITQQNELMEETLKKIVKTKKHPDNKEFIQLMQEFQGQTEEAAQLEFKALTEIVKNFEEEDLIQAATNFEQAKINATLTF